MEKANSPTAKCGTVVICLLIIIFGQGFLLRNVLAAGFAAWPPALWGEAAFCAVMLAAVIWCWTHPRGWTGNLGCGAAFAVFGVYLVFNIVLYRSFSELYLSALDTEFPSMGRALVAVKLVLALMAAVAGVPGRSMDDREYADKLRQAVYRQQAEWAKGNAAGARKDFDAAMAKLKENLSKEEIDALLAGLRAEGEDAPDQSVTDEWRGWGGGV